MDRIAPLEPGERTVKILGHFGDIAIAFQPVEPREMRQQQPRIETPPGGDFLPVIIDDLFHPVDRAVRQHFFCMDTGREHRRIPREAELAAGATGAVSRRSREAKGPA